MRALFTSTVSIAADDPPKETPIVNRLKSSNATSCALSGSMGFAGQQRSRADVLTLEAERTSRSHPRSGSRRLFLLEVDESGLAPRERG